MRIGDLNISEIISSKRVKKIESKGFHALQKFKSGYSADDSTIEPSKNLPIHKGHSKSSASISVELKYSLLYGEALSHSVLAFIAE